MTVGRHQAWPPVPVERTMAEVLRRRAADMPDRLAFQFLLADGSEGPRLTYSELDRQSRAIARAMQAVASCGDRVLLLFAPGLEFVPAYFACLYSGMIAVPAYPPRPDRPWHGVESLSRLSDDCSPKIVLTGGDYAAEIRRMCQSVASLRELTWISTSETGNTSCSGWSSEAEDPSAIAHLQYTSGSTGSPKGVVVAHSNVMHNEYMIAVCQGHFETGAAGICGVSWLPFQHDFGLIAGLLQAVYVGGPLMVLSPLTMVQRPLVWLDAISRYRAHTSAGPNFAYDLCSRRITSEEKASLDLSCWKTAGLGAEPIRTSTINEFSAAFAECGFGCEAFYPSYGLAEGTLMVAGGDHDKAPVVISVSAAALEGNQAVIKSSPAEPAVDGRELVGCGRAWLEQRIEIVQPATLQRCSTGEVGEIWVSGPSVAQGYWGRPDETSAVFQAHLSGDERPYLRTGDLGFFHAGELFVTGRLKDIIIVRGQNHYPHDIESTVQSLDPALRVDAGAVFQTDRDGVEQIIVVQEVARMRKDIDRAALIRQIRQIIAQRHGIEVDEVVLVRGGTLPKTTSGKIRRQACKTTYERGQLSVWELAPAAGSSLL